MRGCIVTIGFWYFLWKRNTRLMPPESYVRWGRGKIKYFLNGFFMESIFFSYTKCWKLIYGNNRLVYKINIQFANNKRLIYNIHAHLINLFLLVDSIGLNVLYVSLIETFQAVPWFFRAALTKCCNLINLVLFNFSAKFSFTAASTYLRPSLAESSFMQSTFFLSFVFTKIRY